MYMKNCVYYVYIFCHLTSGGLLYYSILYFDFAITCVFNGHMDMYTGLPPSSKLRFLLTMTEATNLLQLQ